MSPDKCHTHAELTVLTMRTRSMVSRLTCCKPIFSGVLCAIHDLSSSCNMHGWPKHVVMHGTRTCSCGSCKSYCTVWHNTGLHPQKVALAAPCWDPDQVCTIRYPTRVHWTAHQQVVQRRPKSQVPAQQLPNKAHHLHTSGPCTSPFPLAALLLPRAPGHRPNHHLTVTPKGAQLPMRVLCASLTTDGW
jgi:hypothetical protein